MSGGSLKLPGGVKINISKKGVGASINKKGFGIGIGPNGGRVRGSIPGTGLSWSESISISKLKDIIFGNNKSTKIPLFDKEVSSNAEDVCIMCGCELETGNNEKNIEGLCDNCKVI